MSARAFFITGTDTGVGKTTVTCALAAALAQRGHRVGVSKPIETGCAVDPAGQLVPADAVKLKYFSGCAEPLQAICPHRCCEPLAPSVALRREGRAIDLMALGEEVLGIISRHDVAFVEGAGGLMVPVRGRVTFADLVKLWQLELIVVVGNRLGALNHAQLTMHYAQRFGIRLAGYIVNTLTPELDLPGETNIEELRHLLGQPLGVFPWLGPIECTAADRARLAAAAEGNLSLSALA